LGCGPKRSVAGLKTPFTAGGFWFFWPDKRTGKKRERESVVITCRTVGERQGLETGDRNGKEKGKSKKEKVGKGVGNASTHLPIHASTHLKKSRMQQERTVFA